MEQNRKIRCLITLTERQKDSVDLLARRIHRCRENKRGERITCSSFVRCLIDMLINDLNDFKIDEIYTEEDLFERLVEFITNDTYEF